MNIIIENEAFRLELTPQCVAKSIICKETGEECLEQNKNIPFFSLTENRPYNNEIKLAYPNKRTTFNANRVYQKDNKLIVGFELITFEAVVEFEVKPTYITFTLTDFIIKPEDFKGLAMSPPPVEEFRLIQLPVKKRKNFGQWLNVMWDENTAVCVLANSPYARIDSESRDDFSILTADAVKGIKLKGCSATLTAVSSKKLMDSVEAIENDYNLPKGVAGRRRDETNASIYWAADLTPLNVDKHIAYAKAAGFRMMLLYYTCIFNWETPGAGCYALCGDYSYREEYPEGDKTLKTLLEKIKAEGITPGIHFLHTHIGIHTKYITPVADHRLNLTRHFTLAKELDENDTTIFVEQNPEGSVMHEKCRVLKFGGELIWYEDYTTEYPYCFRGCKRGYFDTNIRAHELGTIGGILDISEFCAESVYIDQNSSLQDEVAQKLAKAYNAGFEFAYFDGSEGTNPPFEFHIPNAQYRVYKKFNKEPLFCEGAAKSHFGWHMLSGGNAFDVFKTFEFKEKTAQHPLDEAPKMQMDFTRVNFGWWDYFQDTMPDVYEYGTSKGAAFDCPITMQANTEIFESNPRTADNFEVIRRWEDVRAKKWLTQDQKDMLKNPDKEFILLINESGEYELSEYKKIKLSERCEEDVTAYAFERNSKVYVVLWHKKGNGNLSVALSDKISYTKELGGEQISIKVIDGKAVLPVSGRCYFTAEASGEEIIKAFETSEILS